MYGFGSRQINPNPFSSLKSPPVPNAPSRTGRRVQSNAAQDLSSPTNNTFSPPIGIHSTLSDAMKQILILQMRPEDATTESEFNAFLRAGQLTREQVHRIRVEQREHTEVDIQAYRAIIAGGSPFDVSTPQDEKSDVQLHIETFFRHLFDQILPADFPFFGACSGNGLLGKYLGTSITGKYSERVGPVSIELTEEGTRDPLLEGLPKQFDVLVGHKEACDSLPESAVLLASSDTCPVQMFRIKDNIYSTQFHPEADVDEFILRIKTYRNHGYFSPHEADDLIAKARLVCILPRRMRC